MNRRLKSVGPGPIFFPQSGIALMAVLIVIVALTLGGILALKSSRLNINIFGKKSAKKSLRFVAQAAHEIISKRMYLRMNPDFTKDNGSGVLIPKTTQELIDEGYLFQTAGTVFQTITDGGPYDGLSILDAYVKGFEDDSNATPQVGVFEPCLNACADEQGAEWTAVLMGHEEILNSGINVRGDGSGLSDVVERFRIEVIAKNPRTGSQVVVSKELILIVPSQSIDSEFPLYSNIVSRMTLLNGFVKGAVVQYWDPDLMWGDNSVAGAGIVPEKFDFGEMGVIHPMCKANYNYQSAKCNVLGTFPDDERENLAQFMTIWGVLTNSGISSYIGAHGLPFAAATGGVIIDDADPATGDTSFSPNDAMEYIDPISFPTLSGTFGRDQFGGTAPGDPTDPGTPLGKLSDALNSATPGNLATLTKVDPDGIGPLVFSDDCVFLSTYDRTAFSGTNNGLWDTVTNTPNPLAATIQLPNKGTTNSVVLAPNANCNINVNGTYLVDGDVIIAGDGAGEFFGKGAIYATGNIFITNDVITGDAAAGTQVTIADLEVPTYQITDDDTAPGDSPYDSLALIANGNIFIGNTTNSHNFAHTMTYGNREIPHFRIDTNNDLDPTNDPDLAPDKYDLLVPDGFRSVSGRDIRADTALTARDYSPLDFQVGRHSNCGGGTTSTEYRLNCSSSGVGILPEGSQMIEDTKYDFAFSEEFNPFFHKSGFGYVRNGDGTCASPGDCDEIVNAPNVARGCVPIDYTTFPACMETSFFPSSDPVGGGVDTDLAAAGGTDRNSDIFQGGWIDTAIFRFFAGMGLRAGGDPSMPQDYNDHDSFLPSDISRVRTIFAKLYANGAIMGVASFQDKYDPYFDPLVDPATPFSNTTDPGWDGPAVPRAGAKWDLALVDPGIDGNALPINLDGAGGTSCRGQVTNLTNFGGAQNLSLTIVGGVYARYVNILATEGLCIFRDDRLGPLFHEKIYLIPGDAYHEDPVVVSENIGPTPTPTP